MNIKNNDNAPKPKIFIASSTEGLKVAREIQETLFPDMDATLWRDPGTFEVGEITIESLEKALRLYTFAVIVLTPDDISIMRGTRKAAPRDNLIFELGFFAGRHGRSSVFMVAPEEESLHIPSDLFGVTMAHYRITNIGGKEKPQVSAACNAICRAVGNIIEKRQSEDPYSQAEWPFWEGLANRVVIAYGVDVGAEEKPDRHPRISLRDLEAAQQITKFLLRQNPDRQVSTAPASAEDWKSQLRNNANMDLILIGGGVSNQEFARRHLTFSKSFRLKMGRLCRTADQSVFHIGFDPLPLGMARPSRNHPQAIDHFSSKYVNCDFGLVYNGQEKIYGHMRRVIAIAGVKGNGTLGAALSLTDTFFNENYLNNLLKKRKNLNDTLEIVIKADVVNDIIDKTELIEMSIQGQQVHFPKSNFAEPCDLGISCNKCRFGESQEPPELCKVLLFDLDDTLIDTYNSLITPLENGAAQKMRELAKNLPSENELTSLLLELRRSHPEELEKTLCSRLPNLQEEILAARRKHLAIVNIDRLTLPNGVPDLLNSLRHKYKICLFTSGQTDLQQAKIQKLGLRELADNIVIVNSDLEETKEIAFASFIEQHGYNPHNVIVIGNRLDNEIRAGNRLNTHTIWVRHGEGKDLKPGEETGRPNYIINNILDLPKALSSIH